jgi:Family of unknown function (DUF6082)
MLLAVFVALGTASIIALVVVPIFLLLGADEQTVQRWADIGQALSPVGVLFSGVAFVGIALTLTLQRRELQNQREELGIIQEEQQRSSEVALRQLHTDMIKMAIEDPELQAVWPDIAPGIRAGKREHYCNLLLNLQKVAYETHTIQLAELRAALRFLMTSRDMRSFWNNVRPAREAVTGGDEAEDFFTREVDAAYSEIRTDRET